MGQLAITGGTPVRTAPYPRWPQWDSSEREQLLEALESGKWWATEGSKVPAFEAAWAGFVRSRHCVAVTNGTHALEWRAEHDDIDATPHLAPHRRHRDEQTRDERP